MAADVTTNAAVAAAASAGAFTVATLNVDPQLLIYSACGAFLGMSLAPAAGRVRAILTFIAVVLLCAQWGHAAAEGMNWHGQGARNAIAAAFAVVFHPLLSEIVKALPTVVDGALRLLRLKA